MKPLLWIFVVLLFTPLLASAKASPKEDSLRALLNKTGADTTRLGIITRIIKEIPNSRSEEMVALATDGAALGDSLNHVYAEEREMHKAILKYTSSCYNTLAFLSGRKGDFGQALTYQKRSLQMRDSLVKEFPKEADFQKSLGLSCNNLAVYSQQITDDLNAQKYSERALRIFDSVLVLIPNDENALNGKAKALLLLGNVQQGQGAYDKSLEYFESAHQIYVSTGNEVGRGGALTNMGLVLQREKKFDEAIVKFTEAAEIFEKQGEVLSTTIAYNNMGESYLMKKDYVRSRSSFTKSLEIAANAKSPARQAIALLLLARTDTADGKYADARSRLASAEALSDQGVETEVLADIYRLSAEVHYKLGNYREGFDCFTKYSNLKDSITSSERSRQLRDALIKFDTEKKEQQNEVLRKDNQLKESEILNRRTERNFVIGIGILVLIAALALFMGYKQKQKANVQLTVLNDQISRQKEIIEIRQKETTDSIHYAQKIQGALLSSRSDMEEIFSELVLVFRPKDIVSGDFYWSVHNENSCFLAVCDSTGHGVPGAFMSLLNISYLSEAVREKNLNEPGKIFDHVRSRLIENIASTTQRDGMDGVLICLDRNTGKMSFASAFNAPMVVRNGVAIKFSPDKMPVGAGDITTPFSTQVIQLEKGDMVYLFTDGYADQFGGPKGKKFKYRQLEELLLGAAGLAVTEQQSLIESRHDEWRGQLEQVDDILILGFRYT